MLDKGVAPLADRRLRYQRRRPVRRCPGPEGEAEKRKGGRKAPPSSRDGQRRTDPKCNRVKMGNELLGSPRKAVQK